jgi:hypothetical protein
LFLALLFLFLRFLPMISIFEMRTILPQAQVPPIPLINDEAEGAAS